MSSACLPATNKHKKIILSPYHHIYTQIDSRHSLRIIEIFDKFITNKQTKIDIIISMIRESFQIHPKVTKNK